MQYHILPGKFTIPVVLYLRKLNLLEVCPKCQSEFKPPKPERNEFGTIIVEAQEERLQEALRKKVDFEANFNLIQAK